MAETQHHLKIGESVRIKRGLMTQIYLLFAGMPNERTFSLVITRTCGHMGMAYNLYLPVDHRHFDLAGVPVTVHGISPTTLQLATE